jgi:hypothetical protein
MDRHGISKRKDRAVSVGHFAAKLAEPVAVCGVRFDHADYDEAADYLYLTRGVPLGPADDDTREGHTVFRGEDDRVICLLITGARWHLDRDGAIDVTLHDGGPTTRLSRELVEPLLVETLRYA